MIVEHAVDDSRRVMPARDHPTRSRRDTVLTGEVDAGQVDGLVRCGAGHGADVDAGHRRRPAAGDGEVQVVIQRSRGAVLSLQQLRQVELVGAGREVGDHVMAAVVLEPLEGVGPRPAAEGVVAQTANQQVIAAPAIEDVVAQAAVDHVVAVIAGQGVVEVRAGEVFDTGQGVRARAEGVLRSEQAEVDRDPGGGVA